MHDILHYYLNKECHNFFMKTNNSSLMNNINYTIFSNILL